MAHRVRVKVTRRDGKPLSGARVTIGPQGSPGPAVAVPDTGEAVMPLPVAGGQLFLIVDPPVATGSAFGAAWEKNDSAFWTTEVELDWNPGLPRLLTMTAERMIVREAKTTSPSGTLFDLELRMTRVRPIVSEIVQDVLRKHYSDPSFSYPHANDGSDLPFEYTQSPLFVSGQRVIDKKTAKNPTPQFTRMAWLFEVAPRRDAKDKEEKSWGPKLCGAYLPRDTHVKDFSPPVMVYFAPTANQDNPVGAKIERSNKYADAGYYFDMRFNRNFEYLTDPWTPNQVFAMGLRHQARAGGRKLDVIAPVPEVGVANNDFGRTADPAFLAELVEEIVAYGWVIEQQNWVEGVTIGPPPGLGRVAVGGFSNGNTIMSDFIKALGSAPSSNVLKDKLREIYVADPPPASAGVSTVALNYLGTLPADEVAFRLYVKWDHSLNVASDVRKAVDPGWKSGEPFDATSERASPSPPGLPHRTNAFLPKAAWPTTPTAGLQMHSAIPGTMFTHALRLSQFPKR